MAFLAIKVQVCNSLQCQSSKIRLIFKILDKSDRQISQKQPRSQRSPSCFTKEPRLPLVTWLPKDGSLIRTSLQAKFSTSYRSFRVRAANLSQKAVSLMGFEIILCDEKVYKSRSSQSIEIGINKNRQQSSDFYRLITEIGENR